MKRIFGILLFLPFLTYSENLYAVELVIGEARVEPGIVFIFEGAVKDKIIPKSMHLSKDQTHVHIEARVNWDDEMIPEGTHGGGFVPYLHIIAQVTNQETKLSSFVDLLPHINLVDNFHYARNMSLPGKIDDLYTVEFSIVRPSTTELAIHKDWLDTYGEDLLEDRAFKYENVDFEAIANASRP